MDLQYVYDDSTSPPTQSILQYSVSPDTVYVSTDEQTMYADLTITAYNPSQTDTVTCQSFGFGFLVGAEYGDLTTSAGGIQPSSDDPADWPISQTASESPDYPALYQFSAPPWPVMANKTLAPNQSLYFHLNAVLINEAGGGGEGVVPIFITELTGADQDNPNQVHGQIGISKEPAALSAHLSVNPPTPVTPGASVEVEWSLSGSDRWQLYNADTSALLYDSTTSSPLRANSYTDHPLLNTTYELIAWAGQLFTSRQKSAMVNAPSVTAKGPGTPVDALTEVVIEWTSAHADTVKLEPGNQTADATGGQGQFTVEPAETTTYTLTACRGDYQSPSPATVTVYVNPVLINSFQIALSGGACLLSWQVQSASEIELDTNGVPKMLDPSVTSHEVNPQGQTTYILKANGQDGPATASLTGTPALMLSGQGLAILGPFPNLQLDVFTIEMWFQSTATDDSPGSLIIFPDLICGWAPGGPTQAGALAVSYTGGQPGIINLPLTSPPTTAWRYAALSCDGVSLHAYIEGSAAALPAQGLSINAGDKLMIGGNLIGYIAAVRIWNIYRSAEEIQSDRCNLQPPQPGLVACYDFTQTPFKDASGNEYPLQLNGDVALGLLQGPCPPPLGGESQK